MLIVSTQTGTGFALVVINTNLQKGGKMEPIVISLCLSGVAFVLAVTAITMSGPSVLEMAESIVLDSRINQVEQRLDYLERKAFTP
jgi:hypothetical protein